MSVCVFLNLHTQTQNTLIAMIVYRQNDVEIQTEGLSTFFASNKPTSTSSSTLTRPVVPKNGSTGKSQSDAVLPFFGTTGNSVKSAFSNFESSQKSHSDAVLPKNGSILINTINDTTTDTINDTAIGTTQRTDEKNERRYWGIF